MSRGFLSRWARLKAENQAPAKPEAAPPPEAPPVEETLPVEAEGDAPPAAGAVPEEEPFDLDSLPDIDTLNSDSDYSAFMDVRVPGDLRNRALRKLWSSDPVYAVRDGLNDYDEDFRAASLVGQVVTSAWDVLRGYNPPEEEASAEEPQTDVEAQAQVDEAPAADPEMRDGDDAGRNGENA